MKKQKGQKTAWDYIKNIFDVVLTVFVVLIAGIEIMSFATKGSNYGVPSVFGYQTSVVVTDSMAYDASGKEVYPVGTGIVCKKVSFDSIKIGDDVLFNGYYNDGSKVTIHRVFEKKTDENNNPYYLCRGSNTYAHSEIATQFQRVYQSEVSSIFSAYKNGSGSLTENGDSVTAVGIFMGKLVLASKTLGNTITAMQTPWAIALLIIIPCAVIAISSIIDIVKIKNTPDAELEKQYLGTSSKDNVSNKDLSGFSEEEKKKLKEQMLNEMLNSKVDVKENKEEKK